MERSENTPAGVNPLIRFADDGDLILVVGPEEVKFCVHSRFLTTVSEPFRAMLIPGSKEGNDFASRHGPTEIPLPDDDAASFKTIYAVLHHQRDMVPQGLTASDVLKIAVAASKYLLNNAMTLVSGRGGNKSVVIKPISQLGIFRLSGQFKIFFISIG
jgi:hypothetical protein